MLRLLWIYPVMQPKCRQDVSSKLICDGIDEIHCMQLDGTYIRCGMPGNEDPLERERIAIAQFADLLKAMPVINLAGWDPRTYLADFVNIAIRHGYTLPSSILNDIRVRYQNVNCIPIKAIYTQNLDYIRGNVDLEDCLSYWTGWPDIPSYEQIDAADEQTRINMINTLFKGMEQVLKQYGGTIETWLK